MSAVENIIAMVVLVGVFIAVFAIITGVNIKFFGEVSRKSIEEFNNEKYSSDIDSVLETTEPVSKDNYANLLADSIYYRKSYFDYNAPKDLNINPEIESYFNDVHWPGEKKLQVDSLVQMTFDKMYGKDNYYLEIAPLFVKLRLYFVIDGSSSLENEVSQLSVAIPKLINDFNKEFEVVSRVLVLAEGGLDQLEPCNNLKQYAECRYLHKEELYGNQVTNGWLKASKEASGTLQSILWNRPYYIRANSSFSSGTWSVSADEFLDETDLNSQKPGFFCSWLQLNKNSFESFKLAISFGQNSAGVRINSKWHDAQNNVPVDVLNDFNADSRWQMVCIGYVPGNASALISYKYIAKPLGAEEREGYFKLNELFAFRAMPKQYEFAPEIMDLGLNFPGGVFYEDWATTSVFAAVTAEKENPSALTVIIPISDELSLGSEALACDGKSGFEKVFCEKCNKLNSTDTKELACPVLRSDSVVDRAISLIKPYGYSVFTVLANSCDIQNPFKDKSNLVCNAFFSPYGTCGEAEGFVCGQCFGPDEMQCPGLTLENPALGINSSVGCDKKHCRQAIAEDMNRLSFETGGKMIELKEIDLLYGEISKATMETIEKFKIKAGTKKEREERFVFKKLVPLSNRLFASLQFWRYTVS